MFAISSTPYVPGHESKERIVRLPHQLGVLSLATAFRETALELMNDSDQWGKAELAMWLLGPYSRCTRYSAAPGDPHVDLPHWWKTIDARFVERVIGSARTSVLDVLRGELESGNVGAFASEMIEASFVRKCDDEHGTDGWLPTTNPRGLAERVLALFAADCLSRPAEFAAELAVCRMCRAVEFDSTTRERGICHRHQSGFFGPRGPIGPISSLPAGA
jgi:hypothetical protein